MTRTHWIRTTRVTLVVALLISGAVLAWLAAHPRLYAGQVSRAITRNLLAQYGASFVCRDLEGNPLERMIFRDVSITRPGDDGSFVYVTADSVVVGYDLGRVLRRELALDEITIGGVDVLLRKAPESTDDEADRPARSLPAFPEISVGRVRVVDTWLTITASDGTPLQQIEDAAAEFSVQPQGGGLDVRVEDLRGRWPNRDIRVHQAQGLARVHPPRLHLVDLRATLDSTSAHAQIGMEFGEGGLVDLEITGDTEEFLLAEVLRLIGQGDDDAPRLRWQGGAYLSRTTGPLRIEATGHGSIDGAPLVADEFVGLLEDDILRLETVRGSYRSARGSARGQVRLKPAPALLSITGEVEGVDLSDPWTGEDLDWPRSELAANARLELELGASPVLELEVDDLRGELATLPVDSASALLRWNEVEGLDLERARAHSLTGWFEGNGRVDADDVLDLFVRADVVDLRPWAERAELPLHGAGLQAAGRLTGLVEELRVDAAGTVREVGTGALVAREGRVVVRMPRADDPSRIDVELYAPRFYAGRRLLGEIETRLRREYPVNALPLLRVSIADSVLSASGRVVEQPDSVSFSVELDSLRLGLGTDVWDLDRPASALVSSNRFSTSGVELASETGRFVVLGSVDRGGAVDLQAQVLDGDLSVLERMGVLEDIEGSVSGALQITGRVTDPQGALLLELTDLRLGDRKVERANLVAEVEGARIVVRDFRASTTLGSASLQGVLEVPSTAWIDQLGRDPDSIAALWQGSRLEVTGDCAGLDLERWIEPHRPGGALGRIDARWSAVGNVVAPRVEAQVEVHDFPAEPFVLPLLEARVIADAHGVRVENGRVDLGGPSARATAQLPLYVSFAEPSRYVPDDGIELTIEAGPDVDLSKLPALWPELRASEGRGTIRLRATGDPRHPDWSGAIQIREGAVALEGWSERVRDVEIDGTLSGNRLALDRVVAREGARGRVEGSGEVLFEGLLPDDISLDLRVDRVLVASVPFLRAIGSGDDLRLRLERPSPDAPRAPKITGTVTVDKALYNGEFVVEGADVDPALIPTTAPDWMVDLRIRAQDQVRISNASAELRVQGDVDLIRDTAGLRLRGTVEIPQGRVPLFNNDFTITEGSLDFSRRPLEPEVDIRAETEVPIYDPSGQFGRELERIEVHLTGTFAQPQVSFTSENGLDEITILRLLAGFRPSETGEGDTVGIGDVGLRAGLNLLERELAQRIRGVDTLDIETEEAGLDQMESTRIAVGKYLSSSLYLRFSQGLSVTERDLFLEYQISRRLLFTSELKRRLRETGAESEFNLDLKFRVKY